MKIHRMLLRSVELTKSIKARYIAISFSELEIYLSRILDRASVVG